MLPSVRFFPDIINQFQANYNPTLTAIMSPNQTVLFTITIDSINEMLQFQPGQDLSPISLGELLEKSSKISQSKLNRVHQTFMDKKHQPKDPPPYVASFFTEIGKNIVNMIDAIMGFNTSEYVDELTLVLMSIFTLVSLLLSNITMMLSLLRKSMTSS